MKKIDVLNFITDFRKSPNDIKTRTQILSHFGPANESAIDQILAELQQTKVVRQSETDGEKTFQVIAR